MVDIKARYYDSNSQAMNATFSSEVVPRIGESIYLGEEGEKQSYWINDVTYYPGDELEEDVFMVCRRSPPQQF